LNIKKRRRNYLQGKYEMRVKTKEGQVLVSIFFDDFY